MTGSVKWFDAKKGFGFITADGGQGEYFAHYSEIDSKGYKQLAEGERVEFTHSAGPKGLKALKIRSGRSTPSAR